MGRPKKRIGRGLAGTYAARLAAMSPADRLGLLGAALRFSFPEDMTPAEKLEVALGLAKIARDMIAEADAETAAVACACGDGSCMLCDDAGKVAP